jgi:hypothetical protein
MRNSFITKGTVHGTREEADFLSVFLPVLPVSPHGHDTLQNSAPYTSSRQSSKYLGSQEM